MDKPAAGPNHPTGFTRRYPQPNFRKGETMDAIMDFLGNTWVMVGMGVALLALIGMMIFLRMKPKDEE